MSKEPVFTGVHFWVVDMARTIEFYRLAGFTNADAMPDSSFVRISLANGQAFAFGTLGLTQQYDPGFAMPPAGKGASALQFDLESRAAVDEMHERLTAAGHPSHLAPIDAFWGARYCEVIDPDGTVVGFHSPQDRR